jgi:putative ABC transport system ATP-binding protein
VSKKKSGTQPAIRLEGVSKTYGTGDLAVPVLRSITLDVAPGTVTAIMGPSGSGKSTLMNIIGLLDRPSAGKLWLNREEVSLTQSDTKLAAIRADQIGFVFQSFNLLPRMSALDNVVMPAQYHQGNDTAVKERARQILESLGLGHRVGHKPTMLSGGEKQRVAIARALINKPSIILADEPTGNLDSKSGKEVLKILVGLAREEGKTVLIVTHDPRVAAECDGTINLLDGEIEERHG